MSKEIEDGVDAYLKEIGVTYTVVWNGLKPRAMDGQYAMDKWSADFTASGRPREPEEFTFYTGTGLRQKGPAFQVAAIKRQFHTSRWPSELLKISKPKKPCAASVLSSLVMEIRASSMSFNDWCGEFGYDTDSRKAEKTYHSCQENSDKLRKIFTHAQIQKLEKLMEDY